MFKTLKKTNLILITIDSLRADFVGCISGSEEIAKVTPNLDNFGYRSIIFKNAITQAPYTQGSFSTIFTSKFPSFTGDPEGRLKQDNYGITEILRGFGYDTAGFHSNPFLSKAFGYDRGFCTFEDNLLPWRMNLSSKRISTFINRAFRLMRKQPYLAADGITRKGINWLKWTDEPFFLWLHYMDTHGPYQPKRGLTYFNKYRAEALWQKVNRRPDEVTDREKEFLISSYKEEIKYLDYHLGRFLNFVEEEGFLDNTLIILCADHGDGFNEHGFYSHPRYLYEELIKVPLIVKVPNKKQGKVILHTVGLIDILPTVVDILGLNLNKNQFEGRSLIPLINNENCGNFSDWEISEATPDKECDHISIRTNEWKLIVNECEGTRELYNLINDSDELVNIIDDNPEVVGRLEEMLQSHRPRSRDMKRIKNGELNLDDDMERRLRDLGYLD